MKRRGAPASVPEWQDGWLADTRRVESPNFGPRPEGLPVDLIVVHSISLPPGSFGGDAVERLFTNRLDASSDPSFEPIRDLRVSAHFLIRRDGATTQFVSCDERAWHAGTSSWHGRGDCNDFSIGIELEGVEGGPFDAVQYDSLASLVRRCMERYPIAAVAGHEHIAPGRKGDPGSGFSWSRLRRSIASTSLHWAA